MRLDEYQWSRNPRGIHNTVAFFSIHPERYSQTQLGWIKLVCGSDEYINDIPKLTASGVTPIIRLYEAKFGASQVTAQQLSLTTRYIQAGARWFEFYNEPNLRLEWPDSVQPDYQNINGVIGPLMDNWLQWAEIVIQLGGYPAFPALSETVGNYEDVTSWLKAMMYYLSDNWYDRFRNVANKGLWCATHPYFYNHFYQEATGPKNPRSPDSEDGAAGGWHFEYPADPLTQADDPGRSVLGASAHFPSGDPLGLTGMGSAFMQLFSQLFGGGAIPVIGTEGGITPTPTHGSISQTDMRFPPFNWFSHGEATLACFNWIAQQAPPWMFGLTLWKENDYWGDPAREGGPSTDPLAAVARLSAMPPLLKTVPPIEALAGPGPGPANRVPIPGPGVLHGDPDFHFIMLSPGFDPTWLFAAAHAYWDAFTPALILSFDQIDAMPRSKSLVVTALATPAEADNFAHAIHIHGPNIYLDLIAADTLDTLTSILNDRAAKSNRIG
jgi:hypothetical protein